MYERSQQIRLFAYSQNRPFGNLAIRGGRQFAHQRAGGGIDQFGGDELVSQIGIFAGLGDDAQIISGEAAPLPAKAVRLAAFPQNGHFSTHKSTPELRFQLCVEGVHLLAAGLHYFGWHLPPHCGGAGALAGRIAKDVQFGKSLRFYK